ncbi:MAG: hypothetical protein QXV12_02055 [Candidatus Rehaiarchaeum fermentans]|nr:hypothetical protein [Candidatus Rehaiarchaeum fermentans]
MRKIEKLTMKFLNIIKNNYNMKKNNSLLSQGLPINTIILIAIGVLILVLLVVFVLGGFKGLGAAKPASFSAFVQTCSSDCAALDGSPNEGSVVNSNFCTTTYSNSTTTVLHCYDPNAYGACTFTLANGSQACVSGVGGVACTLPNGNNYQCVP